MTGSYKVFLKRSVDKELRGIPKPVLSKMMNRIKSLSANPRPFGCESLAGSDTQYRVRQNDYRIVYVVDDDSKLVTIIKVGHRGDVYR